MISIKKTALFIIAVLMIIPMVACADKGITIKELYEQTPDYWDGEYEAYGRTISFHAPIYVPDVEKAPVLIVTGNAIPKDSDNHFSDDMHIDIYEPMSQSIGKEEWPSQGERKEYYFNMPWSVEGKEKAAACYAVNNEVSLEDAINDMQHIVDTVFGEGTYGIFADHSAVNGPFTLNGKERDFSDMRGWEGYTGKGTYTISANLMQAGIPIFMGIGCGYLSANYETYLALEHRACVDVSFYLEPGCYNAVSFDFIFKEKEVVIEDIPLCPFSTVQGELERLINEGKLRRVDSVRLGYVVYQKSDETYPYKKNSFDMFNAEYIAIPTWVVECIYTNSAKREITTNPKGKDDEEDKPIPYYGEYSAMTIMINAQTGKPYDPYSTMNSKKEYLKRIKAPEIIRW